jgi:hypothetical protein
MSHADPFILTHDTCDGCLAILKEKRIPCTTCFGAASYCTDECMARAYPQHSAACGRIMRRVAQSQGTFFTHRWQQCSRKGTPELLRHLASTVTPDISKQYVYLIRLPNDPRAKLTLQHPIKQVLRTEWRAMAAQTPCFDAVWRAFIRMAAIDANRLFVVVYPPDLSFGTLIAVGEPPAVQQVFCPCSLHSPRS